MSALHIPDSASTVQVSVVDTTADMTLLPGSAFFGPTIKGFETFKARAYSFFITHTDKNTGKQRRVLFDLGPAKDWQNDLSSPTVEGIKKWGADIKITKYVSEILEENGVPLDSIEAVVWSHAHWDHTGRMSLFPRSVKLITGPGLKTAYYPGYPTVQETSVLERDFAGRDVEELDFSTSSLKIGQFDAIDFFRDGSFYFLHAPGHAVGHVNALARTTASSSEGAPSTLILMGGDSFHHSSQLRPNRHTHLPENIPGPLPNFPQYTDMCPGHIFEAVHPSNPRRKAEIPAHYADDMAENHSDAEKTPFVTISYGEDGKSLAIDLPAAKETIKGLQLFDAAENVFVMAAHDYALHDVVEVFPKGANDWKAKGWKEKSRWRFLSDFNEAVQVASKAS